MQYLSRILSSLLLVVGFSCTAVDAKELVEDSTSVLVVEVPVYVTRDGEPVRGLTAESFELSDQRRKQEILGVDVIDLSAAAGAGSTQGIAAVGRRHFLFVFDLSFSGPNAIAQARHAARELVASGLHETDLVSVATYSARTGPQIVLNFTTDRAQIASALDTLGLHRRRAGTQDPVGGIRPNQQDIARIDDSPSGSGGQAAGRSGVDAEAEIVALLNDLASEQQQVDALRRVRAFSSNFGSLAEAMAQLDGRKHVVFLSEGFDASPLLGSTDEQQIIETNRAAETGEYWNVDSDERFGNQSALGEIYQLMELFRQADCTIQAVDIGGLRTADNADTSRGRAARDGLFLMARETGGELFENFNDLHVAMEQMLDRTSLTYVLSYQPSRAGKAGDFRKLKVKLKGVPKARVSHREGYFVPRPFEQLSAAEQAAVTAQRVTVGAAGGDLSMSVLATAMPQPDGTANAPISVPVLVQLLGADLPLDGVNRELKLDIQVYAFDTAGVQLDGFSERVRLDLDQVSSTLRQGGLKFYGQFSLPPGEHVVRALVREPDSGRSALQIAPVVVPDTDSFFATPALLPENTEQWLVARQTEEPPVADDNGNLPKPRPYPFQFKTQAFVPAVLAHVAPDQLIATQLVAFHTSGEPVEIESQLLAADGSMISDSPVRVIERRFDETTGSERMIAATHIPTLAPGSYTLATTLIDPSSGDQVVTSTELIVPGESTSNRPPFAPPIWMPDLSEIVATLPSNSVVDLPKDELRKLYSEGLRWLSKGRRSKALLTLQGLESDVAQHERPFDALAQLQKLQLARLKQISRKKPENLMPALRLHREAYAQYRLLNQRLLALHSYQVFMDAVRFYARMGKNDAAQTTAADLLTGLASEIYRTGGRGTAHLLLDEALTYDPDSVPALHGIGALQEKAGQYDRALRTFEQLVQVDPTHQEARLRYAINLSRLQQQGAARTMLRTVIDSATEEWVLSLAYQESARMKFRAQEWTPARKLLERAVERLPGDEKLSIQLAYAYERCQQFHNAQAAIDKIELQSNSSARNRYNKSPSLVYPQNSERLEKIADDMVPSFSQALASSGGES